MNQLSEEQQEQVGQIKLRLENVRPEEPLPIQVLLDAYYLLVLLDSDSQAAEGIPDDLPYRIVEAMGLGLTFRSCSCGQLPCARLRPLRDALETVRRDTTTAMRDKCVEKLKARLYDPSLKFFDDGARAVVIDWTNYLIRELQSLTLDQVKPGEM